MPARARTRIPPSQRAFSCGRALAHIKLKTEPRRAAAPRAGRTGIACTPRHGATPTFSMKAMLSSAPLSHSPMLSPLLANDQRPTRTKFYRSKKHFSIKGYTGSFESRPDGGVVGTEGTKEGGRKGCVLKVLGGELRESFPVFCRCSPPARSLPHSAGPPNCI